MMILLKKPGRVRKTPRVVGDGAVAVVTGMESVRACRAQSGWR